MSFIKSTKEYMQSFYYPTWIYGKVRGYVQPYWSTEFDVQSIQGLVNAPELNGRLFIGDVASAFNKESLKEAGITHIVCAILGMDPPFPKKRTDSSGTQSKNDVEETDETHDKGMSDDENLDGGFEYKTFPLRDIPGEQIHECFQECNKYIDSVLMLNPDNKVYIHCVCGVSRSSTLLSAYLMFKEGLTAKDAVELIQNCRSKVQPNDGFMEQLENYEKHLEMLKNAPQI